MRGQLRRAGMRNPGLPAGIERLTRYLSVQVDVDGAVRGRCESRVLESAVMFRLLSDDGTREFARRTLGAYLEQQRPASTAFEAALLDGALAGQRCDASAVLSDALGDFDHFTNARKRALLQTALAAVGAADVDPAVLPPVAFGAHQVHWVTLLVASMRVLAAAGMGALAEIDALERAELLGMIRSGQVHGVWENHVLAHVLALRAAHEIAPGHPVLRHGINQVLAVQNPDGGLPGIARIEVFCTGPAGMALAAAGADPRILARIGDYLERQQTRDGGWCYAEAMVQTDVDTTAYATTCLRAVDPVRHAGAIDAAQRYLVRMAGTDGGLPTYLAGQTSEAAMTAGAVAALSSTPEFSGEAEAATRFLVAAQSPDGTFGRSWSRSEANGIWRALWAFGTVRETGTAVAAAVELARTRLLDTRRADGGWGQVPGLPSDPTSTAYAMMALLHSGRGAGVQDAVAGAVSYLLPLQRPDGGFDAPPDQVAPRPVLFDVPVFTSIFVLWALAGAHEAGAY